VQPISEGEPTTMTLPQFSITLTPIVLTPARSPLEARWYNGLTWTGSTNFNRATTDSPDQPDRTIASGGLTSNLNLGSLRWNSSGNIQEQTLEYTTDVVPDGDGTGPITVIGPRAQEGTISWRTSVGYQQRLIGSTAITPSINLDGSFFRSSKTGLKYVSLPTRLSTSASLNADVYGFFPGVGPLERIRHKFSPAFNWAYSPAVKPSPELEELGIPAAASEERHQISVIFSQTFEAKLKPRSREAEGEPAEPEEAGEGEAPPDTTGAQQEQQARKLTLLAIRTSALAYDLVTGKLVTGQISNSLTSDVLRGLTLRLDHDLFQEREGGRSFDPFLTQLNLGFSIGDRTVAGLFGETSGGLRSDPGIVPSTREFDEDELGMLPGEGEEPQAGVREREEEEGARRPWSLNVNYSLVRQRPPLDPEAPEPRNSQTIRANLGFSPTQNWTMSWRTTYDLRGTEFVDHTLSLRRDLHRWSATFEFWQAANGNFVFNFRINHNDLRDIKFDYRQDSR
jgi:hypothetical protein